MIYIAYSGGIATDAHSGDLLTGPLLSQAPARGPLSLQSVGTIAPAGDVPRAPETAAC